VATPLPLVWPPLPAGDTLDYVLDTALEVEFPLAGASAVAAPSDLTIDDVAVVDAFVVLRLSGGTPGARYVVSVTFVDVSGVTLTRDVAITVTASVAAGPPSGAGP
jgi:hypothetical protein